MDKKFDDYASNLINSVVMALKTERKSFLVVKHYNSFDLDYDTCEEYIASRDDIRFIYHEFDGSGMLEAYEPFLSCIKKLYYSEIVMDINEFLTACEIYEPHRSVLHTYFGRGICTRNEEVIYCEQSFEKKMMERSIINMLMFVAKKKPLFFVLNKLHYASVSTLRIILSLIENHNVENISILSTFNEVCNTLPYTNNMWKKLLDSLSDKGYIVEQNFASTEIKSEPDINFIFTLDNMDEYILKLNNMYNLMAIEQARYYLDVIYKNIEVEKLYVSEKYKFIIFEFCTEIAAMLGDTSDALMYAEAMNSANKVRDMDRAYRYYYIKSVIYMNAGQNESAKKCALKCIDIAKVTNNERNLFRAKLISYMSDYSGWNSILIFNQELVTEKELIEEVERYGYINHLAYIYVFSFDNESEKFKTVEGIDDKLTWFNKGIAIAKKLGNEHLLLEAYRKNVMMASTSGYFDVANYFHHKCLEIVQEENNMFEMAGIYNGLGYNCCAAEQFSKANEYYNKALIIYNNLKNPEYIGETLYNMAVNAMLALNYSKAAEYLEQCLKIVKKMAITSLRVCNVSKLYGLLALCYYKNRISYSCRIAIRSQEQFLDHLIGKGKDMEYIYWDDDLFLYYLVNAMLYTDEKNYEKATECFDWAQFHMDNSVGFLFFSKSMYCLERARLYRKMGDPAKAKKILMEGIDFCKNRGYSYKVAMLEASLDNNDYIHAGFNFELKDISLKDIEESTDSIAIKEFYLRQKEYIEFMTIWQKVVNTMTPTIDELINTSIVTMKNYFNISAIVFVRNEDGYNNVRYCDSDEEFTYDKTEYVCNMFKTRKVEFVTSKSDSNFQEHRPLIEKLFGNSEINSAAFIPLYENERLDSIFIVYNKVKRNWNAQSKKYTFGNEELPIFVFVFRQLLDAIERFETRLEIENMNRELKFVNDRLSQLAITDLLTGLLNRQGFMERLDRRYEIALRSGSLEITFMYVDLDNFKFYNDNFGHDIGDVVLSGFARLLEKLCHGDGYAVRYGGDEFLLVIDTANRDRVEMKARTLFAMIREKNGFVKDIEKELGRRISIPENKKLSCSIGICSTRKYREDLDKNVMEETLKKADDTLYYIKKTEKSRYLFYDDIKDILSENQNNN